MTATPPGARPASATREESMAAQNMFEQAESSGCASRLPNLHVRHRAVTCSLTPQSAPATCPDGQFPFGCPHVLGAAFRGCRGGTSRAHLLPSLTQFDLANGAIWHRLSAIVTHSRFQGGLAAVLTSTHGVLMNS